VSIAEKASGPVNRRLVISARRGISAPLFESWKCAMWTRVGTVGREGAQRPDDPSPATG
jgi:hypothetical protein